MKERDNKKIYQKLDKNLAKFGDSIVNFVVSAALTIFYKKPQGVKVKNHVLRSAWLNTHNRLGVRKPFLMPEDLAEAYIAYLWLTHKLSIEDMIKILISHLVNLKPDPKRTEEAIKRGLEEILRKGGINE
ncbi:MAG: hypothetical protein B6U95_00690 [Thermofilum sp. ex4484_82]|nr:hypothetical protein [Thermoproteales archaeon]OYT30320.1 MAG: hypothetical protein B6U95_00690 [Thermofilum sp. ex4484_82]OYT39925.1 MAG: hypothetical protein B6U96_00700 [Archaeoglobales archaeon ex4484_92]RLE76169.1 MAG: hypothetical protein DRZ80_01505 [Thermoprotei archaeon]RLE83488.1 MAG: hypothetical protein DRJ39_04840 [Thermoprotei archaeon]